MARAFSAEMKAAVEERLKARIESGAGLKPGKGVKAVRMEHDFLMGAAAAIHAIFGGEVEKGSHGKERVLLSKEVPPIWVLNAMVGRSVFDGKGGK